MVWPHRSRQLSSKVCKVHGTHRKTVRNLLLEVYAMRFLDSNAAGVDLGVDSEWASKHCFASVIDGFHESLVHQDMMQAFCPVGATRVILDVITPSALGLTPEKWRRGAIICPPNWPADYSLLKGWYLSTNIHEFAAEARKRLHTTHMFGDLRVDLDFLAKRVFYERPCMCVS